MRVGKGAYVDTMQVRAIVGRERSLGGLSSAGTYTVVSLGDGVEAHVDDSPENVAALVALGQRVSMLSEARIPGLSEAEQAAVDRALGIKRQA